MILPDHQIEKQCDPSRYKHPLVSPFKPENLQPTSIDLTLARDFLIPQPTQAIDLKAVSQGYIRIDDVPMFVLHEKEFALGSTVESVHLPSNLVGQVEGKSSLGRLGLLVHSTAGYIDAGFQGTITLEFFNLGTKPIILRPGLCICQVSFTELSSPARRPYGHKDLGSKYQGQSKTTPSKYAG